MQEWNTDHWIKWIQVLFLKKYFSSETEEPPNPNDHWSNSQTKPMLAIQHGCAQSFIFEYLWQVWSWALQSPVHFLLKLWISLHFLFQTRVCRPFLLCQFLCFLFLHFHLKDERVQPICQWASLTILKWTQMQFRAHLGVDFVFFLFELC